MLETHALAHSWGHGRGRELVAGDGAPCAFGSESDDEVLRYESWVWLFSL